MALTKLQATLLETLYDVATHECGAIIIKSRYYSPAEALIRRGYVQKKDNWPFRPTYTITDEGRKHYEDAKKTP